MQRERGTWQRCVLNVDQFVYRDHAERKTALGAGVSKQRRCRA
jgi:hypothetical protein